MSRPTTFSLFLFAIASIPLGRAFSDVTAELELTRNIERLGGVQDTQVSAETLSEASQRAGFGATVPVDHAERMAQVWAHVLEILAERSIDFTDPTRPMFASEASTTQSVDTLGYTDPTTPLEVTFLAAATDSYAMRNPAVWFYPGSTRLHIRSGTSESWSAGSHPTSTRKALMDWVMSSVLDRDRRIREAGGSVWNFHVWADAVNVVATDGNTYPDGEAIVGGSATDGDLAFQVYIDDLSAGDRRDIVRVARYISWRANNDVLHGRWDGKYSDGRNPGTRSSTSAVATLPQECRPRQRLIFSVANGSRSARIDILPDGRIYACCVPIPAGGTTEPQSSAAKDSEAGASEESVRKKTKTKGPGVK